MPYVIASKAMAIPVLPSAQLTNSATTVFFVKQFVLRIHTLQESVDYRRTGTSRHQGCLSEMTFGSINHTAMFLLDWTAQDLYLYDLCAFICQCNAHLKVLQLIYWNFLPSCYYLLLCRPSSENVIGMFHTNALTLIRQVLASIWKIKTIHAPGDSLPSATNC